MPPNLHMQSLKDSDDDHNWNCDFTTDTMLITRLPSSWRWSQLPWRPFDAAFFPFKPILSFVLSAKGQRLVWKGGKEARSKGMKENPVAAHGLFLKASKQTGAPPSLCLIRIISAFSDLFQTVSECFFKGLQPQETDFFYYDHYFFFY